MIASHPPKGIGMPPDGRKAALDKPAKQRGSSRGGANTAMQTYGSKPTPVKDHRLNTNSVGQ